MKIKYLKNWIPGSLSLLFFTSCIAERTVVVVPEQRVIYPTVVVRPRVVRVVPAPTVIVRQPMMASRIVVVR